MLRQPTVTWPGQKELELPIELNELEGIAGLDLGKQFDPRTLQLTGVEAMPTTSDMNLQWHTEPGIARISGSRATGLPAGQNQAIALLRFSVDSLEIRQRLSVDLYLGWGQLCAKRGNVIRARSEIPLSGQLCAERGNHLGPCSSFDPPICMGAVRPCPG